MAIGDREIRNVGVVARRRRKTSLVEALSSAGAVTRLGRVDDGRRTDFDPTRFMRKIRSHLVAYLDWKGHRVNLVDTRGTVTSSPTARAGLRVVTRPRRGWMRPWRRAGAEKKVWKFASEYEFAARPFVVIAGPRRGADSSAARLADARRLKGPHRALQSRSARSRAFKGYVDSPR